MIELNKVNIYKNIESVFSDLNEIIKEHDHIFIFDIGEKVKYENEIVERINKKINNNLEIIRSIKDCSTISFVIERMSKHMVKNIQENLNILRCFAIIDGDNMINIESFNKFPQVTILISQ